LVLFLFFSFFFFWFGFFVGFGWVVVVGLGVVFGGVIRYLDLSLSLRCCVFFFDLWIPLTDYFFSRSRMITVFKDQIRIHSVTRVSRVVDSLTPP